MHKKHFVVSAKERNTLLSMHKKHFIVLAKERNTVSYAQETLCCLGKRKKNCPVHKKHFVVLAKERNTVSYFSAKERNTVFYAQETLYCLGKRKKNCFLYIRNTSLSWQKKEMKEILFSVHKKHFVVSAREIENSVSFLCLCIENSVSFFCRDNKVFLVHRKQCFFLFPRQQSVSCAPNMHWKQFRCLLQW